MRELCRCHDLCLLRCRGRRVCILTHCSPIEDEYRRLRPDRNRQPKLVTRKQSVGHEEVACPVRATPNRQVSTIPASTAAEVDTSLNIDATNSIETLEGNSPVVRIGSSCRLVDCTVGLSEMPGLEHARRQSNNRRPRTRCDRRTQAPAQVLLKILARDAELSHHSVQGGPGHSEASRGRADHATRFPKHPNNMLLLHLLQRSVAGGLQRIGPYFGQRSTEVGTSRENDRPFNEIFELSHVTRPRPAHQGPHRVRRYLFNLLIHFPGVLLCEVSGEYRYILRVIAQRRCRDREALQPVIESASEKLVAHHLCQITIGGGH